MDKKEKLDIESENKLNILKKLTEQDIKKMIAFGGTIPETSNRNFNDMIPVINDTLDNVFTANTPKEYKENIKRIKAVQIALSKMVATNELTQAEKSRLSVPLIKALKISNQALIKSGGKIKKSGRLLTKEETFKGSLQDKWKKNKGALVGSALSFMTGSPIGLMVGDLLDERRTRKEQEKEELKQETNSIIQGVYLKKWNEKLQKQEEQTVDVNEKKIYEKIKKRNLNSSLYSKQHTFNKGNIFVNKPTGNNKNYPIKENNPLGIDFDTLQKDVLKSMGSMASEIGLDDNSASLKSMKQAINNLAKPTINPKEQKNYPEQKKYQNQQQSIIHQQTYDNKNAIEINNNLKEIIRLWGLSFSEAQIDNRDKKLEKITDYLSNISDVLSEKNFKKGILNRNGIDTESGNGSILDTITDVAIAKQFFSKGKGAKDLGKAKNLKNWKKGIGKGLVKAGIVSAMIGASESIGHEEEYMGRGTESFAPDALMAGGLRGVINSPADFVEFAGGLLGVKINANAFKMEKKTAGNIIKSIDPFSTVKEQSRRFEDIGLKRGPIDLATANDEDAQFYRSVLKKYDKTKFETLKRIKKYKEQKKNTKSEQKGETEGTKPQEEAKTEIDYSALYPLPNVNLSNLDPKILNPLTQAATEYQSKTGKKVQVNSGYRSIEEQTELYNNYINDPDNNPKAAKPGKSFHNYGLAADIQSDQANEMDKMGLLSKYNLERPVQNEPWHIQPKGVQKQNMGDPITAEKIIDHKQIVLAYEKIKHQSNNVLSSPNTSTIGINNQTNVVQNPDLRFFIDDPYLRFNLNMGIV